MRIRHNSYIRAAEYDEEDEDFLEDDETLLDEDDDLDETLDDVSDKIEDIQDTVDDIQEDDVDIETENNIENHYIAECELCQGVFISAVIENEQRPEKVSGTCPLCGKESDQYLRWVVHPAD